MKFKSTFIAATLLLSISSAQAALVETDWKTEGDALATLDTDSGIEWLDLTQTRGRSIEGVRAEMTEGGVYDGWRLPTSQELLGFFDRQLSLWGVAENKDANNAFYRKWTTARYNSVSDPGFDALHHYIGNTFYRNESGTGMYYQYSWGMSYDEANDMVALSGIRRDANGGSSSYREVRINSNLGFGNNTNHSHAYYGVFLVSDGGTTRSSQLNPNINANNANAPINNVSAPALLSLAGLGMLGIAARRRSHGASKANQ